MTTQSEKVAIEKTKDWSTQVVTILVALTTTVTVIYASVKPEVKDLIQIQGNAQDKVTTANRALIDSTMAMLKNTNDQVSILTASLRIAEDAVSRGAQRIAVLETEVEQLKHSYEECKNNLDECLGHKKVK